MVGRYKKIMIAVVLIISLFFSLLFVYRYISLSPYLTEQARQNYENSMQYAREFAKSTNIDLTSSKYSQRYSEDAEMPYGFQLADYGLKGEDGVLKIMQTVSRHYYETYGLFWEVYFMASFDLAYEKYNQHVKSIRSSAIDFQESIIDRETCVFFLGRSRRYQLLYYKRYVIVSVMGIKK